MNRSQLIDAVAAKTSYARKQIEDAVSVVFDSMTEALSREERIEIRGLGSFTVRSYGSYKGRNPRTGQAVDVGPKRLPFFKVGKELKEIVDGRQSEGRILPSAEITEEQ